MLSYKYAIICIPGYISAMVRGKDFEKQLTTQRAIYEFGETLFSHTTTRWVSLNFALCARSIGLVQASNKHPYRFGRHQEYVD